MLYVVAVFLKLSSFCNFGNLERVNWRIHLVNNLSNLLSIQISPIWRIKNEELDVIKTPSNPSPSFLKKLPNGVIELLSLPSLYSLLFLISKQVINIIIIIETLNPIGHMQYLYAKPRHWQNLYPSHATSLSFPKLLYRPFFYILYDENCQTLSLFVSPNHFTFMSS